MRELTERVSRLRTWTMNWRETQRTYIGRRLLYALEIFAETESVPWMRRKAMMLANVIRKMPPEIHPDERIVGYHFYGSDSENGAEVNFFKDNPRDRTTVLDHLEQSALAADEKAFIRSELPRVGERLSHSPEVSAPPEEIQRALDGGVFGVWCTVENHTVVGYDRVVREGLGVVRDDLRRRLSDLDWSDPETVAAKPFWEAALLVVKAACGLGQRYAAHAQILAEQCTDADRRDELTTIANCVRHLPERGARSFREAVQSYWFAHMLNSWEDTVNANSLGRMDHILYPYYRDDPNITEQEAFELICCLWLKLYREYDVQQTLIGGVDADGEDASNDITYMILDAADRLNYIRSLAVRLHAGTPERLLECALTLVAKGGGIPFFYNDNVIIPALVGEGIPLEDARNYATIGCIEPCVPGKTNPHASSNQINLAKCLELALNNGCSMTDGEQLGPETGMPQSMDDLWIAYVRQVEHFVPMACWECNRRELEHSRISPMVMKSILTEGCIEHGRDFNAGGAVYNYHQAAIVGIPNVADSLAAIDELVFRRKRYTLLELRRILLDDFPNEAVRQEFLNGAPKYGNDCDAVDEIAVRVMNHVCDVLKQQRGIFGGGFHAQPFTYLWQLGMGKVSAASADGRHCGESLAHSISPMHGRDQSDLTAVLNTLAKLPQTRAAGSTSAIVELEPSLFTQHGVTGMAALMRTAIAKGVGQLQLNVVNEATLRQAQQEPERFRNLKVRVTGFSQKFGLLDKELQDHIIARSARTR